MRDRISSREELIKLIMAVLRLATAGLLLVVAIVALIRVLIGLVQPPGSCVLRVH